MWELIDTGTASPKTNMRLDADLLQSLDSSQQCILHLYSWKGNSATYGYFVKPERVLNMEAVADEGLSLAKRPTGGGIIFHQADLAFSVLIPATSRYFSMNTMANYAFVNDRLVQILRQYMSPGQKMDLLPLESKALDQSCRSFCMAKPTKYDIVVDGRKLGGAAQRQTKWGFLHQGSLSIALPKRNFLKSVLLPKNRVFEGILKNSYTLLGEEWTQEDLEKVRKELKALLIEAFVGSPLIAT